MLCPLSYNMAKELNKNGKIAPPPPAPMRAAAARTTDEDAVVETEEVTN